jgi:hypothetical protein
MSKYHAKSHHWHVGALHTIEHFFETLQEAIAHAEKSEAHTVKVYSLEGELQYIKTPDATDTYA